MKNVKTETIMSEVSFGSFSPGWYKPYYTPTYSAIIDHPHHFSPAETETDIDTGSSTDASGGNNDLCDFSSCGPLDNDAALDCAMDVLDSGCSVGGYSEGWGGSDVPW